MRALLIGLLLLALAAGAWFFWRGGSLPLPQPEPPAAEEAQERPAPAVALPRFDIVRVDRSGSAVVAGTGAPGATVELLAGDTVLGEAVVEADGAWALYVETPLNAGPVELSLRQTTPASDGSPGVPVLSEETVIIYVPEHEGDAPIVLRTLPGGATEVLQRATDPVEGLGPLAIETIDYDDTNSVIFSGRATPGAAVELFLDGQAFAPPVLAGEDGRWSVTAQVPPGRYRLRAVQYGEEGRVAHVVEVPFERASFDDVVLADGGVIVQPGNSLWVISRVVYGEGRQYTILFAANMDQIEDPDLIYPGQVIVVPEEDGSEEE